MEYLNLYGIAVLSSLLPIVILFSLMWAYERDKVLGVWSAGTGICLMGIAIRIIGCSINYSLCILGHATYALGEAVLLIGCFKLIIKKGVKNKKIYRLKRIFYESIGLVAIIVALTGWSLDSMNIFLGIWYLIVMIAYCGNCGCELMNKMIFSLGLIFHGIAMLTINLFEQNVYMHLLMATLYNGTCILLAIAVMLIYYCTSRKEVCESLSLADEILHNTAVILNKVDCDGHIVYSNKGLKTMLGYEDDWIEVSQLRNYIHEKDLKQMGGILESLNADKGSAKFQFRLRHHKGYFIWMGLDINPIFNSQGIKTGNVLCCRDITTEKITYQDLVKSQRKFYQLFHGIQDAIFIVPFSTDYVHSHFNQFNKAACENFGYEEDENKAMCLADLDIRFLEDKDTRQGKTYEELIEVLVNEQKVVYETEYRTKENKLIPVEVTEYKFTLNNKEMLMAVVRDISDRNLIKEVKALEKMKSEFLANVSHELRTPLNVIIVTLQSLELYISDLCEKVGCVDEKGQRYTGIMKQNALRLLKLVNNFMCMAKIESGFYETNKQNYNIVSLVEDISHSVITYIEENGITFEFDTDVEEKVVACDVEMMEKVILNLISNAVKFTAPGGILLINIKDKGDKVKIIVEDSGIGIPQNKQKVVFERFRQADKTFTRKQEGCGIGLSLVKHFIKAHDGTIQLESYEGIGSKFTIELPAFQDENVPYLEYNFDSEGEALYKRALEFSDIINRKLA